jgi:hypothetical protein
VIRKNRSYASFYLKDDSVELKETEVQEAMIQAAAREYAAEPQRLVITSANDGEHSEGSLHYEDEALDLRVWQLDDHEKTARRLQDRLGPLYDVIAEWRESEDHGWVPSHIHIEYDPS